MRDEDAPHGTQGRGVRKGKAKDFRRVIKGGKVIVGKSRSIPSGKCVSDEDAQERARVSVTELGPAAHRVRQKGSSGEVDQGAGVSRAVAAAWYAHMAAGVPPCALCNGFLGSAAAGSEPMWSCEDEEGLGGEDSPITEASKKKSPM